MTINNALVTSLVNLGRSMQLERLLIVSRNFHHSLKQIMVRIRDAVMRKLSRNFKHVKKFKDFKEMSSIKFLLSCRRCLHKSEK